MVKSPSGMRQPKYGTSYQTLLDRSLLLTSLKTMLTAGVVDKNVTVAHANSITVCLLLEGFNTDDDLFPLLSVIYFTSIVILSCHIFIPNCNFKLILCFNHSCMLFYYTVVG